MNVLVVGGTRFLGVLLTWRLLAAGHRVTLFNRGTHPDPFGDRVTRVRGDRTRDPLPRGPFDAVVDLAAYRPEDVRGALRLRTDHYVFVSSGQVYLVLESPPTVAREEDYDGPVMSRPEGADGEEWDNGIGKRGCEDLLAATPSFPSTRLRIPMVNGELDYYRRIESYLWRILDGGPVFLPNGGGHVARHVYGATVAATIVSILGKPAALGRAFNLAQAETPTLAELVRTLVELAGAPERIVAVSSARLEREGIEPRAISPFSTTWMSCIDPDRARRELGFRHPPLRDYLASIVASFFAHPPASPPENYANRARELALIGVAGPPGA